MVITFPEEDHWKALGKFGFLKTMEILNLAILTTDQLTLMLITKFQTLMIFCTIILLGLPCKCNIMMDFSGPLLMELLRSWLQYTFMDTGLKSFNLLIQTCCVSLGEECLLTKFGLEQTLIDTLKEFLELQLETLSLPRNPQEIKNPLIQLRRLNT